MTSKQRGTLKPQIPWSSHLISAQKTCIKVHVHQMWWKFAADLSHHQVSEVPMNIFANLTRVKYYWCNILNLFSQCATLGEKVTVATLSHTQSFTGRSFHIIHCHCLLAPSVTSFSNKTILYTLVNFLEPPDCNSISDWVRGLSRVDVINLWVETHNLMVPLFKARKATYLLGNLQFW